MKLRLQNARAALLSDVPVLDFTGTSCEVTSRAHSTVHRQRSLCVNFCVNADTGAAGLGAPGFGLLPEYINRKRVPLWRTE